MHDEIIAYVRENSDGVSSHDIAKRFLKFKDPPEILAHKAVTGVLGTDRRCHFGDDRLWHAFALQADPSPSLRQSSVSAVHILAQGRKLLYVGVRALYPKPENLFSVWLVDPRLEGNGDGGLVETCDRICSPDESMEALAGISARLAEMTPVFLNSRAQAIFAYQCSLAGESLAEQYLLISHLFRLAGLDIPRPLDLAECHEVLLGRRPLEMRAQAQTVQLADCVDILFEHLNRHGIETQQQIETEEERELDTFDFANRQFSAADLRNAPATHGVYGFKNRAGEYVYIGKSVNVRRRLCGYFRPSDESPAKLARLRDQAYSFTVHPCGSELESLLYEHRLINKYHPKLNTQAAVDERSGPRRPIDDCVVLLPHPESDRGVMVWIRSGQKIQLRPFLPMSEDTKAQVQELQEFFFSEKTTPEKTDFAELEIATRWIQRRDAELLVVPVYRMASGSEVAEAIRTYWRDGGW